MVRLAIFPTSECAGPIPFERRHNHRVGTPLDTSEGRLNAVRWTGFSHFCERPTPSQHGAFRRVLHEIYDESRRLMRMGLKK